MEFSSFDDLLEIEICDVCDKKGAVADLLYSVNDKIQLRVYRCKYCNALMVTIPGVIEAWYPRKNQEGENGS